MALFSVAVHASGPLEKVSLQLDWKYQFQFAGYIAAKEKGFYRAVGLDVKLIEYEKGISILDDVVEQKVNYGISKTSILSNNGKIIPVKLLATYFQRSPNVLLTSKDIISPNDLIGKVIMLSKESQLQSAIAPFLNHFYLNNENTHIVDQSFTLDEFIEHKVDAVSIYTTNELFELNQKKIPYNIIDPADYGYQSTSGHLYTSLPEFINYPERTRKFLEASTKGWEYALSHPDEIIDLIIEKYSPAKSLMALKFEATETQRLMRMHSVPVGSNNNKLRESFLEQLKRSRLLSSEQALYTADSDKLFNTSQQLYLQIKKEIKMCVDPDWMPFESIINNQHIGIMADVIARFNLKLPIPITLVATKNWQESILKVKNHECDILSLAIDTQSRRQYLDFTSALITAPYVLATKNDTFFIDNINDVKDKKIGVVNGNAIAEILREQTPDINIVDVASVKEGLSQVNNGEIFGYIDNLMVIANTIQKEYVGILKVSSRLEHQITASIGTRNDEPYLNQVFEVLAQNINQEELQSSYNKWVPTFDNRQIDYSLIWKLLIAGILLSVGYFYYYLKLTKLNDRLLTLSITDKLTGLYNRVKTDEVLIQKKAELDRYDTDLSVILLDIDLFKTINDQYGHLVGDQVLIDFARIIKDNVRTTDYVGRWGGEEFLIISPNIDSAGALELAEKLLTKIREHSFSGIGVVTASAGINQFSKTSSIEQAISRADEALYKSKKNGRNQAMAFS